MEGLSPALLTAALITLAAILGLGVWSGRQVKGARDFEQGGGNAGSLLVAGAVLGTLVGGNSTVGTAQLAFTSGFSALWFAIGASAGCLVLGFVFCGPLRDSGCATIQQIIRREFGQRAGVVTAVLSCVGMVINIVAQLLAANALFGTLFGLEGFGASLLSAGVVFCYGFFGGVKGAGLLGVVKMCLLYAAVLCGGILALGLAGQAGGLTAGLPTETYRNLMARGPAVDVGAALSVALGVLSTKTYVQALLSGKTTAAARRGIFLSAALIPPVGVFSTVIGLFMRKSWPELSAAQAFPAFVLQYLPPAVAGVVLAALLIAVVGTTSGTALGLSHVLTSDLYRRVRPEADDKTILRVSRGLFAAALALGLALTTGAFQSAILSWGFLSMGLRAAVLFAPLCVALFLPGRVRPGAPVAGGILAVAAMLLGKAAQVPFDTLFLGMGVSVLCLLLGRKPRTEP